MDISNKLIENIRKYCTGDDYQEILFIKENLNNISNKKIKHCFDCKVEICDIRDKYLEEYGHVFIDGKPFNNKQFKCYFYTNKFKCEK